VSPGSAPTRKVTSKGKCAYAASLAMRIAARKDKTMIVNTFFMMRFCLRQFFRNHSRVPHSLDLFEETDSEPAAFVFDLLVPTATNSNACYAVAGEGAVGHVGPLRVATL